jgi:glycosyltransferase involved in cell wall biosynthesis
MNKPDTIIYCALPVGSFHGWGVCGKYIVKELARLCETKLISEPIQYSQLEDELDFRLLSQKRIPESEFAGIAKGDFTLFDHPVLQSITGKSLMPQFPSLRGTKTVGYTFFEDNILPPEFIENGKKFYDVLVTGSTWCEEVLRKYGLENVQTIIQGVDPRMFNPLFNDKEYLEDRFVIFSGGKFEIRKGQDIVIRAVKVMQERYKDVVLVNSWYNMWPESMATMKVSSLIKLPAVSGEYRQVIGQILSENGIDLERTITLPPLPNIMMPRIYKNTDIGLFPNRCEGGTNLVLMEYMACGKPVITSFNSGHKDVVNDKNSILMRQMKTITMSMHGQPIAQWDDPSFDEAIERLDHAYHHRDELKAYGKQAGEDMAKITWADTAKQFYDVLTS